MKQEKTITIRTWGDFACFTRPEMKVERVSYPVPTPSAARGILEAIFWEPQMYYIIDSIRIIKRGHWISIRRNEIENTIGISTIQKWIKDPSEIKPIKAGGGVGTQRNMLALQDVEYLITAEVRLTNIDRKSENTLEKYVGEIKRRASLGKCYHRPCLGMRELVADFEWVQNADEMYFQRTNELGIDPTEFNEDLGLMLYDVFDFNERNQGFRWITEMERHSEEAEKSRKKDSKRYLGKIIQPYPCFFEAKIRSSILDCHPEKVHIITKEQEHVTSPSL